MDEQPTPLGIVQCLTMLAEEAASLRLDRTLAALRAAMDVCAAESDGADPDIRLPAGARLH
jgi:hypothetical protein